VVVLYLGSRSTAPLLFDEDFRLEKFTEIVGAFVRHSYLDRLSAFIARRRVEINTITAGVQVCTAIPAFVGDLNLARDLDFRRAVVASGNLMETSLDATSCALWTRGRLRTLLPLLCLHISLLTILSGHGIPQRDRCLKWQYKWVVLIYRIHPPQVQCYHDGEKEGSLFPVFAIAGQAISAEPTSSFLRQRNSRWNSIVANGSVIGGGKESVPISQHIPGDRLIRVKEGPIKAAIIFGTRPEAIKLAPLVRRLAEIPDRFRPVTIVTAQHRQMLDQVLELFSIQPDHDLHIIRPRQTLAQITAHAITGLDDLLAHERPDFVVVQGDTSTTLMGALAAYYHKIPVAHVEAGLRTKQKFYPFPEEMNRRLTSALTDAHFAPTAEARQNLLDEGISADCVWVTGNTVIDALKDVLRWDRTCNHPVLARVAAEHRRMILVTSHRRENQGKSQEQICSALLDLVTAFQNILVVFPVHLSPAVRDTVMPRLEGQDRIILLDPLNYFDTVHFMKASFLILTDSGGIQEEAPALGKPVLVLRHATERPEGLAAGTVRLVGTDPRRIVEESSRLLSNPEAYRQMSEAVNPYGDGHACERILQALEHLAGRAASPQPFLCATDRARRE
jgi:UDP-N-acetylglucosamine 2-epimerase (non-hydrolysing)